MCRSTPVGSPDFLHVDAALNVARRRVLPDQSSKDVMQRQESREMETLAVQFALDDPPFVPDFRLSTMHLPEPGLPIVATDYFAWDLHYRLEYFARPIDESQSLLWITGTVANEGETSQAAHVRAKVNVQPECDLFDYHYVPFYWDVTKWLPCDQVSLHAGQLMRAGQPIGRVDPQGFDGRWEDKAQFTDEQYNRKFGCGSPYFVAPPFRLKSPDHVVRRLADLRKVLDGYRIG